jgi:hypothetical protein
MIYSFIQWRDKNLKWLFTWGQTLRPALIWSGKIEEENLIYYSPIYCIWRKLRYQFIGFLVMTFKINIDNML